MSVGRRGRKGMHFSRYACQNVLADDNATLAACGVSETGFIVLFVQPAPKAPAAAATGEASAATPVVGGSICQVFLSDSCLCHCQGGSWVNPNSKQLGPVKSCSDSAQPAWPR